MPLLCACAADCTQNQTSKHESGTQTKKLLLPCFDHHDRKKIGDIARPHRSAPEAMCIYLRVDVWCVCVCESLHMCIQMCALEKERDGRQVSGGERGEGRASKSISPGSESTIHTDSGVFSL